MAKKEIITQNNIKQYFDYRAVGPSQLKPGMLVSFRYQSPDRQVHDVNPLVYILERKGDRVYGLNLHYHFGLMGGLILNKRKELEAKTGYKNTTNDPSQVNKPNQPPTNQPNKPNQPPTNQPNTAQSKLNPRLVKAQSSIQQKQQQVAAAKQEQLKQQQLQKQQLQQKQRIPPQLLEVYELQIEPVTILRNYLFRRMSGLQKLTFKP